MVPSSAGVAASARAASASRSIAIQGPSQWPTSPLTRRGDPGLAWNGLQLLVWSGVHNGVPLVDGSAFHVPRSDWEKVPTGGPSGPVMASATDGGGYVVLVKRSGAALDPSKGVWRALPRLSDRRAAFRAVTSLDNATYALVTTRHDGDVSVAIARLDADAEAWKLGPSSSHAAHARDISLTVDRGGLAVWSDGERVAHYDVERRAWTDGDGLTVPDGLGAPQVVGTDDRLVAVDRDGHHVPAAYDRNAGRWVALPGARKAVGPGASAVADADDVIVWGGVDHPGPWDWTIRW